MNSPFEVLQGEGGIGSGKPLDLTAEERKERRRQQIRNAQRRYREAHRGEYNEYMNKLYHGEQGNVDKENWKKRNSEAMERYLAKKKMLNIEKKGLTKGMTVAINSEKRKLLREKKDKINDENKNKSKKDRVLLKNVKLEENEINEITNKIRNKFFEKEIEIANKYSDVFKNRFTDDFLNEDLRLETFKPNYNYKSDVKTGFEPKDYENFFKQDASLKDIDEYIGDIRSKYADDRDAVEEKILDERKKLLKKTKKEYYKKNAVVEDKKDVKDVKVSKKKTEEVVKKKDSGINKYIGKTYKGYTFTEDDINLIKDKYKNKEIPPAVMNNLVGFELDLRSIKRKMK